MSEPRVRLLFHTPNPEKAVLFAAKVCYSNMGMEKVMADIEESNDFSLVRRIVKRGHHSVLEHASFTFGIEGISRACSHQLVRHRIASYSQQSQRYVPCSEMGFVMPESFKKDGMKKEVELFLESAKELYRKLVEGGVPKEDARFILPTGMETKIVVTMNARELLHFFTLRLCERAQWEIRKLALLMLKEVKEVAPNIFRGAGPPCVRGPCPEGKEGCGRMEEVRSFFREFWNEDATHRNAGWHRKKI